MAKPVGANKFNAHIAPIGMLGTKATMRYNKPNKRLRNPPAVPAVRDFVKNGVSMKPIIS